MRDVLNEVFMFEAKEWNQRLLRLIDRWNGSSKRNPWDKKVDALVTCWNIWHYQIIGQKPTLFTHPKDIFIGAVDFPL